jgi:hypothetical protein
VSVDHLTGFRGVNAMLSNWRSHADHHCRGRGASVYAEGMPHGVSSLDAG